MRELTLLPNVPLDVDAQYCDIVRRRDDYFLRLKGRGEREFEVLWLDFGAATAALKEAGVLEAIPRVPDAMSEDQWKPVPLRHRALRITRRMEGDLDVLEVRKLERSPAGHEDPVYVRAVDFILDQVVPRFARRGIPVGDLATAHMVNAVYNNVRRRDAAPRGGGNGRSS